MNENIKIFEEVFEDSGYSLYELISYVRQDMIDWNPGSYVDKQLKNAEDEGYRKGDINDILDYVEAAMSRAKAKDSDTLDDLFYFIMTYA